MSEIEPTKLFKQQDEFVEKLVGIAAECAEVRSKTDEAYERIVDEADRVFEHDQAEIEVNYKKDANEIKAEHSAGAEKVKAKTAREALRGQAEEARLSKRLASLREDVPLPCRLESCRRARPNGAGTRRRRCRRSCPHH